MFTSCTYRTTLPSAFRRDVVRKYMRFGHVRQLDAVAARLLTALSVRTPLLPGADQTTFIDINDTVREVRGSAKQGAGFGYRGVRGLNALLATLSTPTSAPVIAAVLLRSGSVNSARGARRIVADALAVARTCGAGGTDNSGRVLVRMDSALFTYDALAPVLTHHACFSVTARMNPAVTAALTRIAESAWTAIRYPQAVWDDDEQRWISDVEVAEIPFTAFTGRRKAEHVTGRPVVRRVKRLQPRSSQPGSGQQSELFSAYRYHAFFTNSTDDVVAADPTHRAHAIVEQVIVEQVIVEQVIVDLKIGPLAYLPSGVFNANAAWPTMATIAFDLIRAADCLAGSLHARATTGTLRAQFIDFPVLDAARVRAGQDVFGVACGTGVVARHAADQVGPTGSVTGVDLNPAMLAVASPLRPDLDWRQATWPRCPSTTRASTS